MEPPNAQRHPDTGTIMADEPDFNGDKQNNDFEEKNETKVKDSNYFTGNLFKWSPFSHIWKRLAPSNIADEKDHDGSQVTQQSTDFEEKNKNEDKDSIGLLENSLSHHSKVGSVADEKNDDGDQETKQSKEKETGDTESTKNCFPSSLWRFIPRIFPSFEGNIQTDDKVSKESNLATNGDKDTESEENKTSGYPIGTKVRYLKVINKRTIAKEIIELCGNEGHEDSSDQKEIRTLLQGAITFFERQSDESLAKKWEDADLIIFSFSETIVFRTGKGSYKFVVQLDGKNEVVCLEVNKNKCIIM